MAFKQKRDIFAPIIYFVEEKTGGRGSSVPLPEKRGSERLFLKEGPAKQPSCERYGRGFSSVGGAQPNPKERGH